MISQGRYLSKLSRLLKSEASELKQNSSNGLGVTQKPSHCEDKPGSMLFLGHCPDLPVGLPSEMVSRYM